MATKKLTAQQKRDRDFMELLDTALQTQEAQLRAEFEGKTYNAYMQGFHFGVQSMDDIVHDLPWHKRLFYKSVV